MSKRAYSLDLTKYRKVIVGEGESDRSFFAAFCASNGIDGFDYAFTGMLAAPRYEPSGFDCFVKFLPVLARLSSFDLLTDVILVCDRAEDAAQKLTALQRQIREANRTIGRIAFSENPNANVLASEGSPRVHVLMIPHDQDGGLESVCATVARDHLNTIEAGKGTQIELWVNRFSNDACVDWTTEKRDKLRLQGILSAAWRSKPELHFSQLFDITQDRLVPLNSPAFQPIRTFLQNVAAL